MRKKTIRMAGPASQPSFKLVWKEIFFKKLLEKYLCIYVCVNPALSSHWNKIIIIFKCPHVTVHMSLLYTLMWASVDMNRKCSKLKTPVDFDPHESM